MASSRITGITIEIGGDTSSLSKALSSVNSEIKTTQTQLKDVEKLLKFDPTNTELLAQKQRALTTEIADTKTKLDTMKTAATQANDALAKGEISQQQYDALQREIIATEQELKNLCKAAAEANTTLQQMGAIGTTMQNVGASLTSVGKSLTMGVTMPLAAIGTASVKASMDFESAMSEVQAISGATAGEMDMLGDAATEMSNTSVWSAKECAEAMKYMGLAGWDAQDMISGLPGILNLATAANMELSSASDIVTDYLTAFGLTAQDCEGFVDQLAYAMSNSNTDVEQLGEAYKNCAANGTQLGFELEDITAALMVSADAGIKGSKAGTALSSIMTRLANNTSGCRDVLAEYGVEVYDSEGKANSLSGILNGMKDVWATLTDEQKGNLAYTIAGKNAQSDLMTILGESTGSFDEYLEGLNNCNGAAQEMADIMEDTAEGQAKILMNQIENLGRSFGDILMPILKDVVEWLQGLVEKFNNLDEGTKETITKIGLVAAAIGPLLIVLGSLSSAVGTILVDISKLGTGILNLVYQAQVGVGPLAALQTAIAGITAPVAAVIAVVGTLVAAFTTLWNTNEEFRNSITAIWEEIQNTVGEFIQGVIDRLNDLGFSFESIGDLVEAAKELWMDFCNVIAPLFTGAFQAVSDALSFACDQILAILDMLIGLFTGNWDQFWQGVSEFVSNIWNNICNIIENLANTIWNIIGNILGLINADWQEKWNSIGEFISNIWENIKTAVSNALDTIFSTVGNVISNIDQTIQNGLNEAKNFILNLVSEAIQWGSDLIGNIATGIKNAIGKVTDAVKGVADKIKSFLHFSVPDEGPLTDIQSWMPDMVQTLADGINQGAATVQNACSQLASAAMSALETGLNQSLSIAQNFTSSMEALWNSWIQGMTSSTTSFSSQISSQFTSLFTSLQSSITSFFSAVESELTAKLNSWKQNIDQFLQQTQQTVEQSLQQIQQITQSTFESLNSTIQTYMTTISTTITTMITEAITNYTTQVNTLASVTEAGFAPAISYIEGLVPKFRTWGVDMMDNLIQGIKSKEAELRAEMSALASMMSDYMEFSVPKKGPLSNADTYMPDMMKLFAEGIKDNRSLVTDQLNGLAADMSAITAGTETKPTINLNAESVLTLDGKVIATSVDKYLGVTYG